MGNSTYPLLRHSARRQLASPNAAYVHIPFCRRRCYYCDFPISVVGDSRNGSNSLTIEQYINALCQEIALTPSLGQPLTTVFFGGGTPSLLSTKQLYRILNALDQQFGIARAAEISMEMDPGTFAFPDLEGYCSAGVNRVSLGVQAFQPELLTLCGRTHTVSDIYRAVELLDQAHVPNFSLDLISGLPHQSLSQWRESLDAAVAIAPHHLSIYDLTVEPVTAFGRQYQPGIAPLPSDTTAADMYRLAQQTLTVAGYDHYEISNYAQPGYQCRHNRVYWENRPFYGFGMGATSYLRGDRVARPRKLREYYHWLETLPTGNYLEPSDDPTVRLNATDLLLDTLMLNLRLAEGVSIPALVEEFGHAVFSQIWQCLSTHYQQGWVAILNADGNPVGDRPIGELAANTPPFQGRFRLTDPEGFLFSNLVLADLFAAFESLT